MRWPFGPPHLTLKPSKKKTKNKKKKNKKERKKRKQRKQRKKHKKYQKRAFQLSVNFFFFLVGVQNFPFLTTWPKKRAPQKHYKNKGFSNPFFGKQFCVTKRPFLDKKTKSRNSNYHVVLPFLLFRQQKHNN